MLNRKNPRSAKVGFFAVGHDTYWGQFEGLVDQLMQYHGVAGGYIRDNCVEVMDYGMVDSNAKAFETAQRMQADGLDLVICNMVTYATSSTFAPIIQKLDIPVVLLALQPKTALDYTQASTRMQLENDNICSVPEFTGVAIRMGKRIADVIIGTLYDDSRARAALKEWCEIAKVLHSLKGARIGLMGHVLEAMYDMHADPTAISAAFGLHVPLLEIDDVVELYEAVTPQEMADKVAVVEREFDMPDPKSDPVTIRVTQEDLTAAAQTAVALDKLVQKYDLTGLAYYYGGREGTPQRQVASSFIVGNSLLNAQGVPMCGEYDLKTCIAMLIMDRLDIGGSFAEFHPLDFKEDFILVGHDGPHHIAIADGKPLLRSLVKYHGKPGHGRIGGV